MDLPSPQPFTPDAATLASLGLVFSFVPISQLTAAYFLPKNVSRMYYYLFLWCSYDVLTHTIVEGSYLYHCFFSYIETPALFVTSDHPHPASLGRRNSAVGGGSTFQPGPFLGRNDRIYGAYYSSSPMARLWQEYAKADRRWGGADPTIISLELLTVFGAGPLAFWMCCLITKITNCSSSAPVGVGGQRSLIGRGKLEANLWFTAVVLSTAELYGGFITFAPEWLTMNTLLEGGDVVYLWLYLVFFNMIWVFIPAWVLWFAWKEMGLAFERAVAGSDEQGAIKKKVG